MSNHKITVGQLKSIIGSLPDESPVVLRQCDDTEPTEHGYVDFWGFDIADTAAGPVLLVDVFLDLDNKEGFEDVDQRP